MGKDLAIKGHPTRGKEIIELLKMLGGDNRWKASGEIEKVYYSISNGAILYSPQIAKDTVIFTLDEFYKKYPYKVGDIVKTGKDEEGVIKQMRWVDNNIVYWVNSHKTCDWTQTLSVDVLDKYNRLNSNDVDAKVEITGFMQVGKTVGIIFNDANYEDEVELNLGDYEIVVRDGKTYAVKKKSKYPTTYAECSEVLVGRKPNPNEISFDKMELCLVDLDDTRSIDFQNPYLSQLNSLFRLRMCRDAYWKVYGEETGLGKPWEPAIQDTIWGITRSKDEVEKYSCRYGKTRLLEFPTEKMRDTFYENFKDLIEHCKELL